MSIAVMPGAGTEQMLRIKHLVAKTGLSRSKLQQLIASGELPHTRVGRSVLIAERDYRCWLESLAHPAGVPGAGRVMPLNTETPADGFGRILGDMPGLAEKLNPYPPRPGKACHGVGSVHVYDRPGPLDPDTWRWCFTEPADEVTGQRRRYKAPRKLSGRASWEWALQQQQRFVRLSDRSDLSEESLLRFMTMDIIQVMQEFIELKVDLEEYREGSTDTRFESNIEYFFKRELATKWVKDERGREVPVEWRRASSFTSYNLQQMFRQWYKRGYASAYLQNLRSLLKGTLNYLTQAGVYTSNPIVGVSLGKHRDGKIKLRRLAIGIDEVLAFVRAAVSEDQALLYLFNALGIEAGALAALQIDSIEWTQTKGPDGKYAKQAIIHIRHGRSRSTKEVGKLKNDWRPRDLPAPLCFTPAVESHIERRKAQARVRWQRELRDDDPLFETQIGTVFVTTAISENIKGFEKRHGLIQSDSHSGRYRITEIFRHLGVEGGKDIRLNRWLGQAGSTPAEKIYRARQMPKRYMFLMCSEIESFFQEAIASGTETDPPASTAKRGAPEGPPEPPVEAEATRSGTPRLCRYCLGTILTPVKGRPRFFCSDSARREDGKLRLCKNNWRRLPPEQQQLKLLIWQAEEAKLDVANGEMQPSTRGWLRST